MGLFQRRPEQEEKQWAGLPSEPSNRDAADTLEATPAVDPLALGFGTAGTVSSIAFPVVPPAPGAASTGNREPEPDED